MRIARVTINKAEIDRIGRNEFMRRVDASAVVVQAEMIRLTTLVDGAQSGIVKSRSTGRRTKKLRYGVRRSKPGESPYKQTGQLSQSIAIERDPSTLTARVGDGVRYGSILELGMNRPHMQLALTNMTPQITRILGG
jgi:hypothetical protein